MREQKKRNISWLLILVMVWSLISPGTAMKAEAKTEAYEKPLAAVSEFLKKSFPKPTIEATGADMGESWAVMANARTGKTDSSWYRCYYDSVYQTVKEKNSEDLGTIGNNAKAVIALTAMGADPENVAGKNLLQPLADFTKISGDAYGYSAFYALIALDAKHYEIPASAGAEQTSREKLVNLILSYFNRESGYIDFGWGADLDTTATALQALAPYYQSNQDVKAVADKAFSYLSTCQNGDGTYGAQGWDPVCTTAQMLTTLSCYGVDAKKDARFIKNGKSVLDGILMYAREDGSIAWESAYNPVMDCYQAAYALSAYDRLKKGENSLYDMSDAWPVFLKTPGKAAIKKAVSPKQKQIYVTWKKKNGISGYELQVSSKQDFKKSKTKTYTAGKKQTDKRIKKVPKKTFYVRIRTYKTSEVNERSYTVYSAWSAKKKIKVK